MSQKVEINQVQAFAVTLFASALIERCQEMIVRLASQDTVVAEIAEFCAKAKQHVTTARVDLAVQGEADARRLACEHIEEICSNWLGVKTPAN